MSQNRKTTPDCFNGLKSSDLHQRVTQNCHRQEVIFLSLMAFGFVFVSSSDEDKIPRF